MGCELCEVEHALGNRAATPAQAFDQFAPGPSVWPRQLEFTLSNRCNLECEMCFGELSSKIRTRREGLLLNAPEAIAIACDEMHLAARRGGSFEDVLAAGRSSVAAASTCRTRLTARRRDGRISGRQRIA